MIEGQAAGGKSPRLRYGMIGGGPGAFIGDVHRKAMAMDRKADIVCGCFSQTFENTLATGDLLGLPKDRLYPTFKDMIEAESARPDRPEPIKAADRVGRNDPCPCGSGKKFKKCCGRTG